MMKKLLQLVLIFACSIVSAQDFESDWRIVQQFEREGLIKSAQAKVFEIEMQAKEDENEIQKMKCYLYQSKFLQVLGKQATDSIFSQLELLLGQSSAGEKSLYTYIKIILLKKYLEINIHQISKRTPIPFSLTTDYSLWDVNRFENEIQKLFQESLSQAKKHSSFSVNYYATLFEISPYINSKNISLYDFIWQQYMDYLTSKTHSIAFDDNKIALYDPSTLFLKNQLSNLSDIRFKNIMVLYQQKEQMYHEQDPIKASETYLNRLGYLYKIFKDTSAYHVALHRLITENNPEIIRQKTQLELAKYYLATANKITCPNNNSKALEIASLLLNTKTALDILSEAEIIKNKIKQQSLSIKVKKIVYPNENSKLFINFQNIDSIYVKYYKIDIQEKLDFDKMDPKQQDSVVSKYCLTSNGMLSFWRKLPQKKDFFKYTTEILLEKIPIGSYILVIEATQHLDPSTIRSFQSIDCSTIFYQEESIQNEHVYHFFDRKTGIPIREMKLKKGDNTYFSNNSGTIIVPKIPKSKDKDTNILAMAQQDTLFIRSSSMYSYHENDKINWLIKPLILLDKAIYRPGQTVFYKGYIFQQKNNIKSVLPKLSANLIVRDAKNDILKNIVVQSNDMGTFSGSFELPKNILNGEFEILIEEPDLIENDTLYYDSEENSHTIWDQAELSFNEFKFKVDSYKKPTFKINFEPIKQCYTIGDTIAIKGHVTSFSGSSMAHTTLVCDITKNVQEKNNSSKTNYQTFKINTNDTGFFEFFVHATDSLIAIKHINHIRFSVEATATDSKGESQSKNIQIQIAPTTMILSTIIDPILYVEQSKKLVLKVQNTNHFDAETTGIVQIYKKTNDTFYANLNYEKPELQTIPSVMLKQMFPYDALDESETIPQFELVKTIPFDTQKGRKVNLDFLNNSSMMGAYKIVVSAVDNYQNPIENTAYFVLKSNKIPYAGKNIFGYLVDYDSKKGGYMLQFTSKIPQLCITPRVYVGSKLVHKQTIILENGKKTVFIPILHNDENHLFFHFSTIWNHEMYMQTDQIFPHSNKDKIDIKVANMRYKFEPGSHEKWSFQIQNPFIETEVLASMYDISLDQFTIKNWDMVSLDPFSFPNYPIYSIDNWGYLNFKEFKKTYKYPYFKYPFPKFNWYGFDFNEPKYSEIQNNYAVYLKKNSNIPKQAKTISGVIESSNLLLPGVLVCVKGTQRVTFSDFDGQFTIAATKGETLVFSYIGYQDVEIPISKSKFIPIAMREIESDLKEVVVIGYGTIKNKKSLSYSTQNITNEDLEDLDFKYYRGQIYLDTVSGKLSGVAINEATFEPHNILIRGSQTMPNGQNVLIFIDGKQVESTVIEKLNPDDILKIDVLKPEQAIHLYGARGGVILITTKKNWTDLTELKVRQNFSETAFFKPHLMTDAEGKITFEFTSPESLTEWKLRLFAHQKNANFGQFETTVVAQKELMVVPNMPRFVREKDHITCIAKIANLTSDVKKGHAALVLYDASNGEIINAKCNNITSIKPFECKSRSNTTVSWLINVPEGLQAIQYKIVAQSDAFSDGETNILPVLCQNVLITESVPLWVPPHTTRTNELKNLKDNMSNTIKNESFSVSCTTNPIWFAFQSLPYLMEYEHECAEQTFARYYANVLASKIITEQPKLKSLLEAWKNNLIAPSIDESLRQILLAETPWFLDRNEAQQQQHLAQLFEIQNLEVSISDNLKKLNDKMLPSGGFPWFAGGSENPQISLHILSGLGHLSDLYPDLESNYTNMTSKLVEYLDLYYNTLITENNFNTQIIHYLYARSFYLKKYPLSPKNNQQIKLFLIYASNNWQNMSFDEKIRLSLIFNRFEQKDIAISILKHFKETAVNHSGAGMYWLANKNGVQWNQTAIGNQALLIEAFTKITNDIEAVNALKVWLIQNKKNNYWSSTKDTTDAIFAILLQGKDWIVEKNNATITIGKSLITNWQSHANEIALGHQKQVWKAHEITSDFATISINNTSNVPMFGSVIWQYFSPLNKVQSSGQNHLMITKQIFKKSQKDKGVILEKTTIDNVKIGDLITVRLEIKITEGIDFLHLKDARASGFEPVSMLSGHQFVPIVHYLSTTDTTTHFFFNHLKSGVYVFEYDLRASHSGIFNTGIATIESMYSPEFAAHSNSLQVQIQP